MSLPPVDRFQHNPRGIPRALLITLGRTPQRTIEGLRELHALSLRVEIVEATDGKSFMAGELPRDPNCTMPMQPGEVGLSMSWWRACSRIVRDNLPWALVFEDDVQTLPVSGNLLAALDDLPEDFHFAHLSDQIFPAPEIDPDRPPVPAPWMAVRHPSYVTPAYCISNAGARALVRGLPPFDRPIDVWFHENPEGLNIYQAAPGRAFFTQSMWKPSTVRENNVPVPIPHVFHRVWVGSSPMPAEYEAYWLTWKAHHPGWEFKTWGDSEIAAQWPGHPAIAAGTTPAAISDIARLLILERFGGVYVDTDFECFHDFTELVDSGSLIVPDMHEGVPCNGWLASAPHQPWMIRMVAVSIGRTLAGRPILEAAGPAMVKDVIAPAVACWPKPMRDRTGRHIATAHADTGLVVIRPDVMFPYYWTDPRPASFGSAWAAHHWARSWWTPQQREEHYAAHPHLQTCYAEYS